MKKRNTKVMQLITMVLSILMIISCISIPVSASEVTYKLTTSDQALWEAVGDSLTQNANALGLTNSGGVLTFDVETFVEKTDKEQKALIKHFMADVTKAGLSAEGTSTIMDCLNDNDKIDMSLYLMPYIFDTTKGDLIGGMQAINPFVSIINVLIGAFAILACLALVLFSVYDIVLIVVPLFREKLISKADSGATNSKGRPWGVSAEAWSAIMAAESNDGKEYKSAMWIYLKRRLPMYIVFGIALAYLIFGGFGNLMQALLNIGNAYVG